MNELFRDQPVTITGPDVAVTGLAYDSRQVQPGFLFAALLWRFPPQQRPGWRPAARRAASADLESVQITMGSSS